MRLIDDAIVHVVPVNDLREHDTTSMSPCWCKPVVEQEGVGHIVTNNSMDRREEYERGRKKT